MDVLVTCKYEEDLIKNEGAKVDTNWLRRYSSLKMFTDTHTQTDTQTTARPVYYKLTLSLRLRSAKNDVKMC